MHSFVVAKLEVVLDTKHIGQKPVAAVALDQIEAEVDHIVVA